MLYSRRRGVLAVCALLICALLSACGGNDDAETSGPESTGTLQIEPVTMVVQMTGLLLLLPPQQPGGPTHVVMPSKPDHLAYIGFGQATAAGCTGTGDVYRPDRQICYVNMDGWSLEPVGITGGSSPTIPRGVLNLTRGTGGQKVDTTSAKNEIRSIVTLASGNVTDSCGVANWTFDPVGQPGPEKVQLINVLEWQIPNMSSETLELVLRNRKQGSPTERRVTLRVNDAREIELLILHVTKTEAAEFTVQKRRRAPAVTASMPYTASDHLESDSVETEARPHPSRSQAVRDHFNAFYKVLGADTDKRRMPTRPTRTERVCPITILDLEDLFEDDEYRSFWWGVRTYSCIMTSAEGV